MESTPEIRLTSLPCIKTISVGIPRIPNFCPAFGFASVSTFPKTIRPFRRLEPTINVGAKARQGPHQGAQKSITTGRGLLLEKPKEIDAVAEYLSGVTSEERK